MQLEITTNLTIAQLFEIAPDSVTILDNACLKVTGCDARTDRTLEQLFDHHKLSSDQRQKILAHLSKLKQIEDTLPLPTAKDQTVKELTEGNKKYYRLGGLLFTESAYRNLHQVATEKGFQIRLQAGGCSGFQYQFDFKKKPQDDEKGFKLSEKLSIFINDFTFGKSLGSVVEFKLGLHESGLTITNPNKKRACSCGTSIAF